MLSADLSTVQALRRDVALQITRRVKHLGINQVQAARHLGVPQPTLSKIMNARVSDLSLELLIRVAVRAGLPLTLQTGHVPEEAGAFVAATSQREGRAHHSQASDQARHSLSRSERGLTAEQRMEAFLEHNQLIGELYAAGRKAESKRAVSVRP